MVKIDKDGTLTVRDLLEAFASSAVDPDAPVVTGMLDVHGHLQRITGVKLHVASGAVIIDGDSHSGCVNEEELAADEELADLL